MTTGAGAAQAPALEVSGIVKRFGSMAALDDVSLTVNAGEVHALLGENGAGKTTLMNVASGILRADRGTIRIAGEVAVSSPRDAAHRGLGMVHQSFRLVESFTVAENIHLGWEDAPAICSSTTLERRTAELAGRFGMPVDPGAPVWQLSVGEKQRVAILRALARGARTLVLDEPTSVLTPHETELLFVNLRAMVAQGRTVVFISHKLREVLEIADRISVLRAGRHVATIARSEADVRSLVELMVGREIAAGSVLRRGEAGRPILVAAALAADGDRGLPALNGADLEVASREVVGVASVSGNGAWELAEVLTGMRPLTGGTLAVDGRELMGRPTRDFLRSGIGHIPESHAVGLALGETVEVNAAMKAINDAPIRRGPFVDRSAIRSLAAELLAKAKLQDRIGPERRAVTLSGGQAQRLIVQRELRAARSLLVAAYPTRGLDVAATDAVQRALIGARDAGVAVLLISEDLDELFRVSDRIVVMYEGRIAGRFARDAFDRERIGYLMTGGVNAMADVHLGGAA